MDAHRSAGQFTRSPLRLSWGSDSLEAIGRAARSAELERMLVVTGRSVGARADLLELLQTGTGRRCVDVFTGVRQHSPVSAVLEAVEAIRTNGADGIVAVGGGSAMVTARAANILHGEGRPLEELATRRENGRYFSPRLEAPKLPMFVVPTTPTTAASKAGSAVTDPRHGHRLAMFDPKTRARTIAVHPEFVATAPAELVTTASLNATCMAFEGLVSTATNVWSDATLIHAGRRLTSLLAPGVNRGDPNVRIELVLASIMAGDGSDTARGGVGAALSHTIGHRYGSVNGVVEAVLLPHVLRRVADDAPGLRSVAWAMDLGVSEPTEWTSVPDAMASLLVRLGAPQRLRDVGVDKADLPMLAQEAMSDFAIASAPAAPDTDALEGLLRAAW